MSGVAHAAFSMKDGTIYSSGMKDRANNNLIYSLTDPTVRYETASPSS